MNRLEMEDALMPQISTLGGSSERMRQRLHRLSASALRRELQLRGLLEYEYPDDSEAEFTDEVPMIDRGTRAMLCLPSAEWLAD
jgi:hypothetical protein